MRATYESAEGDSVALLVEVRNPEGSTTPADDTAQEPEKPLLDQPKIPKRDD